MKVICISGKAGSGKDTVGALAKAYYENQGKRVLVCHFADLVKYVCRTFFNWNGLKDEKGRGLLQYVGTDVVRAEYPNYWVDFIETMLRLFNQWDYVIIPDCRFPNEYDRLAHSFPTWLIRVERPGNCITTAAQSQHSSETAMDDFLPDYTILNDSTLYNLCENINPMLDEIEAYEE